MCSLFDSTTGEHSSLAFTRSKRSRVAPSVSVSDKKLDGVHVQVSKHLISTLGKALRSLAETVQMETFASVADDSPTVVCSKMLPSDSFDPEAQHDYKKGDYYNAA